MVNTTCVLCTVLCSVCLVHSLALRPVVRCSWWQFWNSNTNSCWSCSFCKEELVNVSCTNWCGSLAFLQNFKGSKVDTTTPSPYLILRKDDSEQWRKLSYALIGVLCFLILVAPALFAIRYVRSKRINSMHNVQYVLEDGNDLGSSGDYVVIHRRPPNAAYSEELSVLNPRTISPLPYVDMRANRRARYHRLRRVYRPKRRMMNEYVDDVFESEDSAGSRSSARLPLSTIPERCEAESSS
ncbi:hypothetical protein FSP39_023959 [Pinctada imbricata]|uniref:Uncharacterized protein n=1 Tax=Pinctada imbricata TaxID=66713 RepID=A0AA89C8N1_PINIB|nr:hypothetical protein FSP39_023959 [Pinctada imbricata]